MSADDYEQIATVKLMRSRRTGKYAVHTDLGAHAEAATELDTIDVALELSKNVVRDELASRVPEELERDPHRNPLAFVS